jgi:hypothetical protein
MGRDVDVIWVKRTPESFCEKGWTGSSVICPSGKIRQRENVNTLFYLLSCSDTVVDNAFVFPIG